MKYKNIAIASLLMAALAVVGLILLLGDGSDHGFQTGQVSLRITEVCTKNETVIADNDGKFRDYIELYAPEKAVSLQGYVLTDGKATSQPLEDITIEAGQYRVFFLSDETTGFALRASGGDVIQLKTADGAIAAQVSTIAMAADQSMVYTGSRYSVTNQPSPGFSNTREGEQSFREGRVQNKPVLTISELLVRNKSILPDERGIYSDAVELHNCGTEALNLGSYCLSDSLENRFQYRLPNVPLEADGYLVVFCDGENYISGDYIHANFGLSKGESLYLTDPTGGYVTLNGDSTGEDTSIFLAQTGEYEVGAPSMGYPNTLEGVEQAKASRINADSALIISEVVLSSSGVPYEGTITDAVEIMNRSGSAVSTAGWYLSDGGDPYSYALPDRILKPGEAMVLKCGYDGTGFGLSQGEVLRLTGPDYRHAMPVTCTEGQPGQSMSYIEDGYAFGEVTLGHPNTSLGRESYWEDQRPNGLQISEVMTGNLTYLPGAYGVTCDWVELYNAGKEAVRLKDYTLSDSDRDLGKCQLPDKTLEPGKYYILLLDSTGTRRDYAAVPMALSSQGDSLYLSRNGRVEDWVILPEVASNRSFGRGQGSTAFSLLASVTPGRANSGTAELSEAPVTLTAPGTYDAVESLEIVLQGPGEIYYTTNCSVPTRGSHRYTQPISITETTIFRVVCYEEGKEASQVMDFSYILNQEDDLPVISLVTEPANLWDHDYGIYVDGPNISPNSPHMGANYWKDWERPASVSLFEQDGTTGFTQGCGLKIFGAYSRANSKKAFACMFRSRYGEPQLAYPIFGEDSMPYYEAFVLRAGGQDATTARMRDEVITSLAAEKLGLPVQKYRPVAVYLNGQYWGLYYIREKINEHYVAGHYNVKAEDVALCQSAYATDADYVSLRSYALRHDLSKQEHFDYVASRLDLENYTDYMIVQLWINNVDNSNVKFFKTAEGKWTWVLFDTDMSLREVTTNTIRANLGNKGSDDACRIWAQRLLKNEQYRDYFLRRMAWQINNVWNEETLVAQIDEVYGQISETMKKDAPRWGTTYEQWELEVGRMRRYAKLRNDYFISQVQWYFKLTDEQMLEYGFPVAD